VTDSDDAAADDDYGPVVGLNYRKRVCQNCHSVCVGYFLQVRSALSA
jgi:hypothetical protein